MQKNGLYVLGLSLFLACTVPALAQEMMATLTGADNKNTGQVHVTPTPEGSLVRIELTGLEEGWHGVHFHEKGLCDSVQKFESAGAHAAMTGEAHGAMTDKPPHAGDLPNVFIHKDGTGKAEFFTKTTTELLNDADGSTIMVHARADDYRTQPSGDSGDRIACGILESVEN